MDKALTKQYEERIDALRLQLINVKNDLNKMEIELAKIKKENEDA